MVKSAFLLLLFVFFSLNIKAQKFEVGMGVGPTFYKGDLQPRFNPFNSKVGGNILFRYNPNKTLSFKANAFLGIVGGDDKKSGDPMNKQRGYKFNDKILDYNAQIEYNFLNFRTHDNHFEHSWTPYLFGGLGQYSVLSVKYISPTLSNTKNPFGSASMILPYGIGIKKILFRQFNIGAEFGSRILLRKKNNDILDGLGYTNGEISDSKYTNNVTVDDRVLKPNTLQPDKYFFVSFSVSYLFYKIYCPPSIR